MANHHFFYTAMWYPIPTCREFFVYGKIWKLPISKKPEPYHKQEKEIQSKNTWEEKNPYVDEFITHIAKYGRLYRSLPCIETIYLCNSLTFNACTAKSDIDIVCITKPGCLWRARFWSVLFFSILWLKRQRNNSYKQFCLSFYLTSDKQNIANIREQQEDIYLSYRLAHLVPLYEEEPARKKIRTQNTWLKTSLPEHPLQSVIKLWIQIFSWRSICKRILECLCMSNLWYTCQKIIKYIWLPILLYKKKKLWTKGKNIIISDEMLKFYDDKRKIYNIRLHKYKEVSQG